jgi:methionyl-tRNA synthetase
MLLAAGLRLPDLVFAHGWLLVGGEKMSKTKLTGISPNEIIDYCGSDAFRYYFMSAIRFGTDGSFSWEELTARYTAELANGLGNLASRLTAMVDRYFSGQLPAPAEMQPADTAIQGLAETLPSRVDTKMCDLDFSGAIADVRELIEQVNGYVTTQEPWVLAKDESQVARLGTVLYVVAEALRVVAVLYNAVMPKSSQQLWFALGAEPTLGPLASQKVSQAGRWGQLPPGALTTKTEPLFPRLPEESP